MPRIDLEPIYLELSDGRRRELAYTMRSELVLRERGITGRPIVERLPADHEGPERYRIDKAVLLEYLFACLQRYIHREGEMLSRVDVEDLITHDSEVLVVLQKINQALDRYYGKPETGEGNLPSQARRKGSKSHSK